MEMENIKKASKYYLKYIGPTGFSLYCYYYIHNKKKKYKFTIKNITFETGISKRSIITYNKLLVKAGLIDSKMKFILGKRTYEIKSLTPKLDSAKFALSTNKHSEEPAALDDTQISRCAVFTINHLKTFTKYKTDYYKREFRDKLRDLSPLEKNNISRLISNFKGRVSLTNYLNWWIDTKSGSFRGFSFGALATKAIIEEYLVKNRTIKDPITVSANKVKKKKVNMKTKKLLQEYLAGIKDVNKEEKDIIKDALKFKLIKKQGKKYIKLGVKK